MTIHKLEVGTDKNSISDSKTHPVPWREHQDDKNTSCLHKISTNLPGVIACDPLKLQSLFICSFLTMLTLSCFTFFLLFWLSWVVSLIFHSVLSFTIIFILNDKKLLKLFSCSLIMMSVKLTNSNGVSWTDASLQHCGSHWSFYHLQHVGASVWTFCPDIVFSWVTFCFSCIRKISDLTLLLNNFFPQRTACWGLLKHPTDG